MERIKEIYYRIKANNALHKVQELENRRSFITEFFCGKTAYPLELKKWESEMKKAQKKFKKYKKHL